jgi:hypothetical protein
VGRGRGFGYITAGRHQPAASPMPRHESAMATGSFCYSGAPKRLLELDYGPKRSGGASVAHEEQTALICLPRVRDWLLWSPVLTQSPSAGITSGHAERFLGHDGDTAPVHDWDSAR